MVNYKIVTHSQDDDVTRVVSSILEVATEQFVATGLHDMSARDLVRHLNFGGGFDGFTPTFFLAESAKMLDSRV